MEDHDKFLLPSETDVEGGLGISECMDPATAPLKMLDLIPTIEVHCGSGVSLETLLSPDPPTVSADQQVWSNLSDLSADPEARPTLVDVSSMETDPQPASHASTMEDAPASPRTSTWGNLQEERKFQTKEIGDMNVDLLGKTAKRGNLFEVERDHSFKPEILLGSDTKALMGRATIAHVLLSLVRSHADAKGKPITACQDHDKKDGHVLQTLDEYGTQYIELTDASGKFVKCLYLKDLPIENGNKIVLPDIKSVCYNTKCSGKNHENIWQLVVQCEVENGLITGRTCINFKSIAHIRAPNYWKTQRLRRAPITPGKRVKMQREMKKTIDGKFTKNINITLTASSSEALAEKERKLLISAQKIEAGE